MQIITLLVKVLAPCLPFLMTMSDKAVEEASRKVGEDVWNKAKAIWAKLYPKVKAKKTAKKAAADVAKNPEDEDLQTALQVQLKKILEGDSALAAEITEILSQVESTVNNPPKQKSSKIRPIKIITTDGHSVELNLEAISEIVEVEKEDVGFLGLFGGQESKYQVHMINGDVYDLISTEHGGLEREIETSYSKTIDSLPQEVQSRASKRSQQRTRKSSFGGRKVRNEGQMRDGNIYEIKRSEHEPVYLPKLPEQSQQTKTLPFVYIYAEMDEMVLINHATTVEVIVSRELLDWGEGETAKTGKAEIDDNRKLLIQIIPKTNFELVAEDRIEVEPPVSENPHHLYFDLRASNLGKGEVWIVARQGQIPLTTLKLSPQIVLSRAEIVASKRTSKDSSIFNAPILSEPLHELFITEHRNGSEIFYRYEILSPSLNILGYYESGKIATNRNDYIKHFYEEIENRWLNSQDDVEAFTAELRAFGGELFDQLFPPELKEILWTHRTSINSIMVISDEPFIPWELVHLKPPKQRHLPDETRFLGQMGLIRWLYGVGWPPEQIKIRKHRVYYIIPHYPVDKYKLPEAEKEYKFLEEQFQATPIEAKANPVRQLLSTPNAFDLLHFACHGQVEQKEIVNAKLLLEGSIKGNKYFPDYLSSTTIGQYCQIKGSDNRPIIILNACQVGRTSYALTGISGFAQAFIEGGCGAFVGPLWSVGDKPARIFTETLYSELLDGQNLAQATINARMKAQQAGDSTWLAYAVYGHPYLKVITSDNNFPKLQTFQFEVAFIEVDQSAQVSTDNPLEIVDEEVFTKTGKNLNDVEQLVLQGTLANQAYEQIAASTEYSVRHLKNVGIKLWEVLSEVFGEKVTKRNLQNVLEKWAARRHLTIHRRQQGQYFIENLGNGVQLEMLAIPEGSFLMGSPPDELERLESESSQHTVSIKHFFFGKYPVTQAQWQAVAALPQVNRELDPNPSHFKGANRPVDRISWYDAVEFCDRLSQHTGKSYRLPSEAEWEYACRAGTTTPFHFGETIASELANYNAEYTYGAGVKGTYRSETTQVGSFGVANAFGLYDMHGNVWEWCLDDWHDNYEGAPTDGSPWFNNDNNLYQKAGIALLRGGCWFSNPGLCRCAYRYFNNRDFILNFHGFRVVCGVGRNL